LYTASTAVVDAGVPGTPTVRVNETSPNMVILEVEPPADDGGKKVTSYRVAFSDTISAEYIHYSVGL